RRSAVLAQAASAKTTARHAIRTEVMMALLSKARAAAAGEGCNDPTPPWRWTRTNRRADARRCSRRGQLDGDARGRSNTRPAPPECGWWREAFRPSSSVGRAVD